MKKKIKITVFSLVIVASFVAGMFIYSGSKKSEAATKNAESFMYAYVTTSSLNVRSGPGTNYSSYGTIPTFTWVAIPCPVYTYDNGKWYQIQLEDKVGYVSSKYITKPTYAKWKAKTTKALIKNYISPDTRNTNIYNLGTYQPNTKIYVATGISRISLNGSIWRTSRMLLSLNSDYKQIGTTANRVLSAKWIIAADGVNYE